jgi:hypothetical protein
MKRTIIILSLLLISLSLLFMQWGCTDKYKPAPGVFSASDESSCTRCHLNANRLKEVATPLPPPEEPAGEG